MKPKTLYNQLAYQEGRWSGSKDGEIIEANRSWRHEDGFCPGIGVTLTKYSDDVIILEVAVIDKGNRVIIDDRKLLPRSTSEFTAIREAIDTFDAMMAEHGLVFGSSALDTWKEKHT